MWPFQSALPSMELLLPAQFILSGSGYIAASGENTTAQLTPPSGKSSSDFAAGRIQDDENPADAVSLTAGQYTEMEWCLQALPSASAGETYQFRLRRVAAELDSYSQTPEWTIASEGGVPRNALLVPGSGGLIGGGNTARIF